MKIQYLLLIPIFIFSCDSGDKKGKRISVDEYRDKMKAAWVGQMAGVGWGLPTEFKFPDQIIPADQVPAWDPEMVNQQGNDDLYVEMTFMASMEKYGLDVSHKQAGIDFANTGYGLWAANKRGRENIRSGIAPPESSHPQYSDNCDDIDYQIEADYSGIIAPGMPNVAIDLGEKFGRIMNYGDGLYGGQFMGGMYAAAYFEKDITKILESGLACIPAESNYAICVRDVMSWHKEYPDDWGKTWQLIEDKYRHSLEYQGFAAVREGVYIPIDAKLNGAYIVLGLLYGNSDMDSTIVISMRGGKDSDCNPSNAAGVLATTIGYKNLPDKFKTALDVTKKFSYSEYDFNKLMEVCDKFTREYVVKNGGAIEKDNDGKEYFIIPDVIAEPSPFHPSYQPGPFDPDNMYVDEELAQIEAYGSRDFELLFEGEEIPWTVEHCGRMVKPGKISWNGKPGVLTTTPMNDSRSVRLGYRGTALLNEGEEGYLEFFAGNDEDTKWRLKGYIRYQVNIDTLISSDKPGPAWHLIRIPIKGIAEGQTMDLSLYAENINGEAAVNYWAGFRVVKED
ncbi:MAG: ADP-ribosylglycohydrolase family protein [Cyclobacteriaceae bacterium]|nr:ADP-ribosylglycohydrolase family protein [Cyclobacteriaceae bacterium]MCK5206690.1 ADP-ribosylglycohydrolase family protein [Cyclobacteriaceae bacterium]MCK5470140.1 ADP-ribosylglycohydrolase family protein [Cyclobacteriaceae bacterium]